MKRFISLALIITVITIAGLSLVGCTTSPTFTEVVMLSAPSKVDYYVGESLDSTGLKIVAKYSDNSTKDITDYSLDVESFEESGSFDVTITVKFEGTHELIFSVTVYDVSLVNAEITKKPTTLNYNYRDEINLDGLEVTGIYANGSRKIISNYKCLVKTLYVTGNYEVKIEVRGTKTISLFFEIYVNPTEVQRVSYDGAILPFTLENSLQVLQNPNNYFESRFTFTGVSYGGPLGSDSLVYYDASNIHTKTSSAYSVAVDANGYVTERGNDVGLPIGGFIVSGSGSSGTSLSNYMLLNDKVVYTPESSMIRSYKVPILSALSLASSTITSCFNKISTSESSLIPLDYKYIHETFYSMVDYYNEVIINIADGQYVLPYDFTMTMDAFGVAVAFSLVQNISVENKAVWHYPMSTAFQGFPEGTLAEVCNLLDTFKAMGINIIYINTLIGGFAIYESAYLPKRGLGESTADYGIYGKNYLECFIGEAHRIGLKVVAWTHTMMCGDGSAPAHIPSEWVLLNYFGEQVPSIYYYDLLNPTVKTHLKNVYTELITKYDFDGVELDHIRYPTSNLSNYNNSGVISASNINDSGYTAIGMSRFMAAYGYSGDMKQLILQSSTVRKDFIAFRIKELTELVRDISTIVKTVRPGTKVTAAIISTESTAKNSYMQDWADWSRLGYIDHVEPMIYTTNVNSVVNTTNSCHNSMGLATTMVNSGISPMERSGTAYMLAEQMEALHNTQASGFVIFSGTLFLKLSGIVNGMTQINRPYSITTWSTKDEMVLAFVKQMTNEITDYYLKFISDGNLDSVINLLSTITSYNDFLNNEVKLATLIDSIANAIIRTRLLNSYEHISLLLR